MGLIGLIGLMGLIGCTDDDEERGETVRVTLAAYMAPYADVEQTSRMTRAGNWWPDGFMPYSEVTGAGYVMKSNERAAIGVFFTKGTDNSSGLRRFRPNSLNEWLIDEEVTPSQDYLLYGFVPYGAVDLTTTTIVPYNGSYTNGATLKLKGLNSVMAQDLCVVVGAKDSTKTDDAPAVPRTVVRQGDFACALKATGENANNHIFLLFDHLYSAIHFRYRIGDNYAKLRTIKVKKLELTACTDRDCQHPAKRWVSTDVTLKANNDGSSPIEGAIVFTPDDTSDPMEPVTIYRNETNPPTLQTGENWTDHIGFLSSIGNNYYLLRTTYDVYDNNVTAAHPDGNLIRKNCTAENKIDPMRDFELSKLERGHIYTLKLTVEPTYLYVLSDPDLDNPTVKIED